MTGVRFTNRNQTLFLQIQQGKLIQRGMVNLSTIQWKSLPKQEEIYLNEIDSLNGKIVFNDKCFFAESALTGKIKKHITIL